MKTLNLYTGYSDTLFNPQRLREAAQLALDKVKRVEHELAEPIHIAVTGKSGIAMAFAMSMIGDVNIVTIRKTNETSHGSKIEGFGALGKYIVLDDFVDSGQTVRRVVNELNDFAASRSAGHKPECVGFIEYCRIDALNACAHESVGDLLNCGNDQYWAAWMDRYGHR